MITKVFWAIKKKIECAGYRKIQGVFAILRIDGIAPKRRSNELDWMFLDLLCENRFPWEFPADSLAITAKDCHIWKWFS